MKKRKWKNQPVDLPEPSAKQLRAMWPHIKPSEGECWPWTGRIHPRDGYPKAINVSNQLGQHGPARLMYHWFKHPIAADFTVDHLCRNKLCMNPDHMEAVTYGENARRAHKKPYCKRGHAQTDENRYHYKVYGKPRSRCKLCIPFQAQRQRDISPKR